MAAPTKTKNFNVLTDEERAAAGIPSFDEYRSRSEAPADQIVGAPVAEIPAPATAPDAGYREPLHAMDDMTGGTMTQRPDMTDIPSAPRPESDSMPIAAQSMPEIGKKMTLNRIHDAQQTLREYKAGKVTLEQRIIDNEQWYKMRYWQKLIKGNDTDPAPVSAWLFNSIANKHADAMDNYPEPSILPREEGDKDAATMLTDVLPTVLEMNDFESAYSDIWWYKLKHGTGVYGVFWSNDKNGQLGDVEIRQMDMLSLFWEPGIRDIQRSKNFFSIDLVDTQQLQAMYPQLEGLPAATSSDIAHYIYDDNVDTSKKTAVTDWYYKVDGLLHYCKFAGDNIIYASEDDPVYAGRGYYDHGRYPFVFDPLFIVEGTPAGFGYIDISKDCQIYIDKLNSVILKNAMMSVRKRFFIRGDGTVNEEEFSDWTKELVHVNGGTLDDSSIREIQTSSLDTVYLNVLLSKIDELKETSGNRDFSQGGTTAGVTAASAIAALQEAGSKLSRDMIKSSYRAYIEVCRLVIELVRQFYDLPRTFRITGENNEEKFVQFDNASISPRQLQPEFGVEYGEYKPIFDIKVRAQRSNPFSRVSQNELAKELYQLGMFNPQLTDQALACLDMMDFEGKDSVVQSIQKNGTLYDQLQKMQAIMMKMSMALDNLTGGQGGLTEAVAGNALSSMKQGDPGSAQGVPSVTTSNPLGATRKTSNSNLSSAAAERAAKGATPK